MAKRQRAMDAVRMIRDVDQPCFMCDSTHHVMETVLPGLSGNICWSCTEKLHYKKKPNSVEDNPSVPLETRTGYHR